MALLFRVLIATVFAHLARSLSILDGPPMAAIPSDAASIEDMSFVPTEEEIDGLIAQSGRALTMRANNERGLLLSKRYKLSPELFLCPASLKPQDTILAKFGRGSKNGGIGPGGEIGDPRVLTIINDPNMPFGSTSNGPNGVLTDCTGKYGTPDLPRINLFYESRAKTLELLEDYLVLRTQGESVLLEMFVAKLKLHGVGGASPFKLVDDPKKEELLDEVWQPHYTNVVRMFEKVAEAVRNNADSTARDFGISVLSFCQTWLRNGEDIGDASFSVMSPHFQTRFYVVSVDSLYEAGVTEPEFSSYETLIEHFTGIMQKDYGGSSGQAFINLDGLYEAMKASEVKRKPWWIVVAIATIGALLALLVVGVVMRVAYRNRSLLSQRLTLVEIEMQS